MKHFCLILCPGYIMSIHGFSHIALNSFFSLAKYCLRCSVFKFLPYRSIVNPSRRSAKTSKSFQLSFWFSMIFSISAIALRLPSNWFQTFLSTVPVTLFQIIKFISFLQCLHKFLSEIYRSQKYTEHIPLVQIEPNCTALIEFVYNMQIVSGNFWFT